MSALPLLAIFAATLALGYALSQLLSGGFRHLGRE